MPDIAARWTQLEDSPADAPWRAIASYRLVGILP
jgi:hypothetical protein